MSRKLNIASKSKATAPSGVIVSRAVKDIKSDSTKQAQSALNESDRQRMIATAAYYRAERRGFDSGADVQDWLEHVDDYNKFMSEEVES